MVGKRERLRSGKCQPYEEPVSDPLATHLHDHLAGSAHAIDLLKAIRDRQAPTELSQFAAHLLSEIEADREAPRRIADSVGAGTSALKEIGAWAEEKISRLKLRGLDENGLGLFEALEFLGLGSKEKGAVERVGRNRPRRRAPPRHRFSSLCERPDAGNRSPTLASETGPGCPEAVLTFATKARKD